MLTAFTYWGIFRYLTEEDNFVVMPLWAKLQLLLWYKVLALLSAPLYKSMDESVKRLVAGRVKAFSHLNKAQVKVRLKSINYLHSTG